MNTVGSGLTVNDLCVRYGPFLAVDGVSFSVEPGSCLTLLGANGAGKTSIARAVSGMVKPSGGHVLLGERDVTGWAPHKVARAGAVHVPEGRGIFPNLTVSQNIQMALLRSGRRAGRSRVEEQIYSEFSNLASRRRQLAGTLSGGEQQILALCAHLIRPPQLLVLDEVSHGLAPIIVKQVFGLLEALKARGVTLLLIEQFVHAALSIADDAVLVQRGKVLWAGKADAAAEVAIDKYMQ